MILVSLDYVITLHFCLGTPYIVCTHLWSFLQFSSALICFILRGANFHRISGVFQFAFLQKAALPRVNQFLVNSLSRYQLRFTYPFNLFLFLYLVRFFLGLYPVLPRDHPLSIYFIELFCGTEPIRTATFGFSVRRAHQLHHSPNLRFLMNLLTFCWEGGTRTHDHGYPKAIKDVAGWFFYKNPSIRTLTNWATSQNNEYFT